MMRGLTSLSLLSVVLAGSLAAGTRPNIVFILCDDLGYGATGPTFQNERAARGDSSRPSFATPALDRFVAEGVQLRRHYAGAPICVASRASLLLGLTQGHAPIRDNRFDEALPDRPTLASVLRQAGYATAAIGKWGLQGGGEGGDEEDNGAKEKPGSLADWPGYPTKRGFDFYFGYVRHKDGHFHYPKEDGREVWENDREVSAGLDLCYTTDLFTARAKRWIVEQRGRQPEQPFFLYLALDTPHAIMAYPPTAWPAGGGLHGGVQWTGRPGAMLNTAAGAKDAWCDPAVAGATWDHDRNAATPEQPWPEVQKRFATSVRRIDSAVGDLLQLLRDLGLDENTLVVFTSDNGPTPESYLRGQPCDPDFFGTTGPLSGLKRDTLEGGIRVPAFVRWPAAIAAGRVDDTVSGQWDWLATFAGLAGLPAPAFSDGVSLLPRLTGQGTPLPSAAYFEYFHQRKAPAYEALAPAHRGRPRRQMQTVYADRYVGVRYDIQDAAADFEIYDLAKDPGQRENLATQPEFAEVQHLLKARALQARRPDGTTRRPYDEARVAPAVIAPPETGGLRRGIYPGQWPWVPDFRAQPANETVVVAKVDAAAVPGGGGQAFTGFFRAPRDGEYTFHVTSDQGAVLFLHEARVIDEAMDQSGREQSGSIRLAAGWHPLRIYSRHGEDHPRLKASWQEGGGARQLLAGENVAAFNP
ncbi:MAG TPA: sulfatase-like hydrolase/transferase [Lacunisphaera sp.]